jgi:16S rRNA (guanine966-N2)-methyltransferase
MRIIAGEFKGRKLAEPGKLPLRPTSDSLRETLFNVLGPTLDGVSVLDAFAGTGALGLEALSRGAAHVTFVESDRRAIALLRENITRCGAEGKCTILARDFLRTGNLEPGTGFDLIVLDPPYDLDELQQVLDVASPMLNAGGRLVLEHSRRRETPLTVGSLVRVRLLVAGDSALSFYQPS